ncbi:hypothetical protein EOA60_21990 [Mesorhizobium sp. M1A.F.Ca.IN.020.06.1.1]|nr:hypothetical protein EOA51_29485 [Mesorhizobium sp. M1A.F.Ca.IN.020.32.1.1]RUW04828.1 hypothetical protein EOA46_30085 [Mesorhizobium sp. M1A.F.Ca.IN.022.05.2.1]RUW23316.1 hypothetical protein EOA60_21990 [Mesorhizobium sp. M1A.F.Ca.IN.020.06.1.1]RWF82301.1 MAG: hypothetical protein EOQ35_10615 [Mesorhizobium sp.]RWG04300.1 MAG: hypothetical protein EOQ38_06380 [Mesorhizobium sp.]
MLSSSKMLRSQVMTVWISAHVLRVVYVSANELSPLETGGFLLGWRSGQDRVVVDLRGPGPRALHGRHCFIPDHAWQVTEIQQAFQASSGDLDYLGDWHSHPNGIAKMSDLDEATLSKITKRVCEPLMLIAAGRGTEWTVRCWKGQSHRSLFWRRQIVEPQEFTTFVPSSDWPKPDVCQERSRSETMH